MTPRRWAFLRVIWKVRDDPMSKGTIMDKIREAAKAVVALAIPALIGAAATVIDGFGDWLVTQEGVWVGVAVGVVSGLGVWLKRNA